MQVAYHDVDGIAVVIQEGGMLPVVTAMKTHQNSAGDLPGALCLFASCCLAVLMDQAYSVDKPSLFALTIILRAFCFAGTSALLHKSHMLCCVR
jgi:hypothetical protein